MATEQATTDELCRCEIKIRIWADHFVAYEGMRDTLEAEGLVPASIEWPRAGELVCWDDGRFSCSLGRFRPVGFKGPKSAWVRGDCWVLRVYSVDRPSLAVLECRRYAEALLEAIHHHSADGQAAAASARRRYCTALGDAGFQAFRGKVPALTPPKRAAIRTKQSPHRSNSPSSPKAGVER